MGTVLSVQDLSCVGRCSLTVALPVLSAMGCRCSVLPTAVLSTHTGFPDPHVIPLTEHMAAIDAHHRSVGVSFDAVLTGYMADQEQAAALLPILRHHKSNGSRIIVDPAMGDHGKLYSRLDDAHVKAMASVCMEADILLPNLTEAALLTGLPYIPNPDFDAIKALAEALLDRFPAEAVVITGVSGKEGSIGFYGAHRQTGHFYFQNEVIPRQCHGTGDLFAATFTGSLLRGDSIYDSAVRAATFVRRCVAATEVVSPHGVNFESQLSAIFA